MLKFEKEYSIHVYETGPDGKLSMPSLFNFLQDIASDHAIRLGFGRDALIRENRFWVLSRIYAVINRLPSWEDTIIAKTWPNGTDKLFALRNFELTFPDGNPIALASSSWLILDRTTRKIQRPDAILSQFYNDLNPNQSILRYASKLDQVEKMNLASKFYRVKISDLDVNLHTNNVKYISWVSDCYELEFIMNNVPRSVEINYLAESQIDDEITVNSFNDEKNGNIYNHSITRDNDKRELCRIRIEWGDKDYK